MWIERKADGLVGPARIGWAKVRDRGKRIDYRNQSFRSLRGAGFKANFYDIETREEYWITGCRKDGGNALYNTDVEIDQDALEEYWLIIRKKPENIKVSKFRACGKY
jgi:hypothetical protein